MAIFPLKESLPFLSIVFLCFSLPKRHAWVLSICCFLVSIFNQNTPSETNMTMQKHNHLKMYQLLNMVIFAMVIFWRVHQNAATSLHMLPYRICSFFRQVGPLSLVGAALICAGSASLAIFELRSMVFSGGDQKLTRLTFTWLSGDNAKNALEDVPKRFSLRTLGGSIDEMKGLFAWWAPTGHAWI